MRPAGPGNRAFGFSGSFAGSGNVGLSLGLNKNHIYLPNDFKSKHHIDKFLMTIGKKV
jgi:UDP-N-acetylglucosamine transferase subunit ALG13